MGIVLCVIRLLRSLVTMKNLSDSIQLTALPSKVGNAIRYSLRKTVMLIKMVSTK